MAERRGADKKDNSPVRRTRRQTEAPEHDQDSDREENLPEQNVYGNTFLLGAMGSQRTDGAPDDGGGGVEQDAMQEYGGIEDDDGAPAPSNEPEGQWFRPTFRRKGGQEFDPVDDDGPDDPTIPPEDDAWLADLVPIGSPWDDPAPQPLPEVLDGGLIAWLSALMPIAGALPNQVAVATALRGDPVIQDPGGHPLLGVAAAAALGAVVARDSLDTAPGRLRVHRGLAIAAAPQMARDAARTACQIAGLEDPTSLPTHPPDPWLARLVLGRLGLERPPVPTLDDPPSPPPQDPDDPFDYDSLLRTEIGPPPDPAEALRHMAVEACEAHAIWAVALRSGAAACAAALVHTGVEPGVASACLKRSDEMVAQAIGLLQEIASAARSGQVPIRGLRNGLARSATVLVGAHRAIVESLAAAAAVPVPQAARPQPIHEALLDAVQDGTALPSLDAPLIETQQALQDAVRALSTGDMDAAGACGRALQHAALGRQDGVGAAAGCLIRMEAEVRAGRGERAAALRTELGPHLLGAGARSGLSLLARWRPESDQAG